MKRLFVACAGLMLSLSAQAQFMDLKTQLEMTLEDISYDLRVTRASDQEMIRALEQLRQVRATLRGEISTGAVNTDNLSCVSRDNDGMNPFVIAIRDPRTFATSKVSGISFRKEDCERAIRNIRTVRGSAFICAARDNDGMAPFVIYALDSSLRNIAQKLGSARSIAECEQTLSSALLSRTHMSICGARDNDGMAPFIRTIYSLQDRTVTRDTSIAYRSMQECQGAR